MSAKIEDATPLHLDKKDWRLLQALAKDARKPYTILAKTAGLSKDAARYRIKGYESRGLIERYLSVIDLHRFGYLSYHLLLRLDLPPKQLSEAMSALAALPFTRSVIKYAGRYDVQVALVARNPEELDAACEQIRGVCGEKVSRMDLCILSKTLLTGVLPGSLIDPAPTTPVVVPLDDRDLQLLRLLSTDARAPYHQLALAMNVSADTVVHRMKRLQETGIIIGAIPVLSWHGLGRSFFLTLFDIMGFGKKDEAMLKELIRDKSGAVWVVKAVGRYNLLIYSLVEKTDEVHELVARIRERFAERLREHEILLGAKQYKHVYLPEGLEL